MLAKVICRCFVWHLWCFLSVFVALFFYVEALVIISRGCDVFLRVFLLFCVFFVAKLISIIVLLIFLTKIVVVDFFV